MVTHFMQQLVLQSQEILPLVQKNSKEKWSEIWVLWATLNNHSQYGYKREHCMWNTPSPQEAHNVVLILQYGDRKCYAVLCYYTTIVPWWETSTPRRNVPEVCVAFIQTEEIMNQVVQYSEWGHLSWKFTRNTEISRNIQTPRPWMHL